MLSLLLSLGSSIATANTICDAKSKDTCKLDKGTPAPYSGILLTFDSAALASVCPTLQRRLCNLDKNAMRAVHETIFNTLREKHELKVNQCIAISLEQDRIIERLSNPRWYERKEFFGALGFVAGVLITGAMAYGLNRNIR